MFIVDSSGKITLRQGDSGKITFTDVPTDKDYTLYFSFYDKSRNIIKEINKEVLSSEVTFEITPEITDLLRVGEKNKTETYYWGLKICLCDEKYENTLVVEDKSIADLNMVLVYPKIVEGC